MRMSLLRRIAIGFGLSLLLAGTACAEPPTPLLWKVSKGQSTVYLLGSMHFLKDGDYPLSPDVDAAYQHAGKLVFEIAPKELFSPDTIVLTDQHGKYHDPKHTLKDDLSPALWQEIVDYGARNHLSVAQLQEYQPWLVSLTMMTIESAKIGMNGLSGLDMHFMQMAAADHKPTSGLETVDDQLSIFYTTPIKAQEDMLKQSLNEIADFPKEMNKEHDIWRRGDGEAMAADAKKQYAKYPELYEKLIAQRNRNWIPQIEKMLNNDKVDTFVVVGALHLAGPDGVVGLLRKKGYTVMRLCTGCGRSIAE